jgi:UDP-N-acetylmuramoyl-L-alanyl-D-glutamate--2,6-diaminopimelate ligase
MIFVCDFSDELADLPDVIRMKLAGLIVDAPVRSLDDPGDVVVTSIVEDSRQVSPGCLFVARSGLKHDGLAFVPDAVAKGAVAVLSSTPIDTDPSVIRLVSDQLPLAAAMLAERLHGQPSHQLLLIGITGTNGKTTTAHLVHHMLNTARESTNVPGCGMIGTVRVDDGARAAQDEPSGPLLTTPSAMQLSPLLARMVANGCRACVMEASSHALAQQRTAGLAFDVAVFTNLSGDHLDYHADMDAYRAAKALLFSQLDEQGSAIVNIDDPAAQAMLDATVAQPMTCSLHDETAMCMAQVLEERITHVLTRFRGPWGEFEVRLPLCGRHNVMNALQCAAVGHVAGLSATQIADALERCTAPPGRLEPVTTIDDPFAVYVDYAHTDDALENVLRALRPLVPDGGQLRVVFGCGGDRDRTKRPRMAQVACRYGDAVIITSDNPRTEDPQAIVDEIYQGVPDSQRQSVMCMVDRAEAITQAIDSACDGDVVLIAGKGHETYQIIGTTYTDFDDRLVAASALNQQRQQAQPGGMV